MNLFFNGERMDVRAVTLEELLHERGLGEARLAAAVNEVFVPASERSARKLEEGDRVEVVAPMQGG